MLAQTAFHRVFQLLSQMAHIRFRSRKRVHTRLCSKDRTQRITGRNRGCFRWGAITTLGAFRTFTNIPGPGIRTTYFAAFRSWSEALLKDTESLRNSDAHKRIAVPKAFCVLQERLRPSPKSGKTCRSGTRPGDVGERAERSESSDTTPIRNAPCFAV